MHSIWYAQLEFFDQIELMRKYFHGENLIFFSSIIKNVIESKGNGTILSTRHTCLHWKIYLVAAGRQLGHDSYANLWHLFLHAK